MSNSQIESVSLFSGAGGLDVGSELNGVKVRLAIDIDHETIETLKLNNNSKNKIIIQEDIKKLKPSSIEKYLTKKNTIIIGGPPCQPFSKNGYWVKNENRTITKDPRNCIENYFDFVKALNPKGFLLENVESILHPTNKKAVDCIINQSKKLNYNLKIIKANALDYGVPQKRRRIFFIGSKKKFQITEPQKTHYNPEKPSLFDTNLKPYETVERHIKDFENSLYKEESEITTEGTYYEELKKVPPGKNYLSLCDQKNSKFIKNTRFWNFLLKLSPDLPSWTIAAQPGPWVGPFHWTNRRLRVPEIAAIQTFPKNYKFYGNRRSIQKQIGNAVPPLLGKQFVKYLVNNLS